MEQTFRALQGCSQHLISRTMLCPPSGPACSPCRRAVGTQVQIHIFLPLQDDTLYTQREFRATVALQASIKAICGGMPLELGRKIGLHVIWLRAVRHPKGPWLYQLAKLHRLPKPKPKPRPFAPRIRARKSRLYLPQLLCVLCPFPQTAHLPSATTLSRGGKADGNKFHK